MPTSGAGICSCANALAPTKQIATAIRTVIITGPLSTRLSGGVREHVSRELARSWDRSANASLRQWESARLRHWDQRRRNDSAERPHVGEGQSNRALLQFASAVPGSISNRRVGSDALFSPMPI